MSTLDEAMIQGTRLHQAGRLAEAEQVYRRVLAADPGHAQALHQLGMLAMQARQFDTAVDLISRAIRSDRMQPAFHANLGEAYRHSGRRAEAAECYQKALKLQPKLAQVHAVLGILRHEEGKLDEAAAALREALRLQPEDTRTRARLGHVLDEQNKFAEAETCFRRVLHSENTTEAQFNLASTLQSQERFDEAAAGYRAALAQDPNHVESHNNLGTVLKAQGHLEEAGRHYREAIRRNPRFLAAHVNLGWVAEIGKRYAEAADHFRAALEIDANAVLARYGLGMSLQKLGQIADAMACYQDAIRLDPTHAESHLSLGYLLQTQGRATEAIRCCQEAIRLNPRSPEAYNNLCVAWTGEGRHDEAIAACRKAIELRPDFAVAYSNLAVSTQSIGLLDEAIEYHRRAVQIAPDESGPHSNLLYILNYHPGYAPQAVFDEHLAWGRRHADPLTAQSAPHTNDRTPGRRLRIGYVSPHFRDHAVNFFTEPILASHDHAAFEVFCYSDTDPEDETSARLRGYADHWRPILGHSDVEVCEQIQSDAIDILVDLTGHISGGKRMLVFARKPAPVQVTYIGYQNTTGMAAMDYRLTDAYADPPGQTDALHTEKLARLPTTFFCYQPSSYAPEVGPLPAAANGHVTFGSVNAFTKITPQVLEVWADILLRVPQSRLIVRGDMTESLRARLNQTFSARDIAPERIELVNRLPRPEYLELIKRMDLALDPIPFNGHTTTCDCLWQGVPVVTLSGETYVSRFGGSGLKTLGLDELITHSADEYRECAATLAGDLPRLAEYRATLRDRMAASPLCDFRGFTANLEETYRGMWEDWLQQQSPATNADAP
ncbi:MAG: tetratricopeptide repeat protein [Planctomycetota bacterium]|nr:MAG: tetratricopeptide repeat protein [Planctomycetota bacterium]